MPDVCQRVENVREGNKCARVHIKLECQIYLVCVCTREETVSERGKT